MRYLKLTVAYDGTHFVGWQIQPNGPSIQGHLQEAWQAVTGESLVMTGSGRTDSGVHAVGQVASLVTHHPLPVAAIPGALNANLPETIVVREAREMDYDFHAIRDAVAKTYRYTIQMGRRRSPFLLQRSWYVPRELDTELMSRAGQLFIGRHDFASLQSAGAPRRSTIRTILKMVCETIDVDGFPLFQVYVTGDGFLYNMVRNLVGTLMLVGRKRLLPEDIPKILAAKDRTIAGPTAPAAGLTLMHVEYQRPDQVNGV
ncbi:MAG: tRNA pseudouridine(38-40) synthase TruA [Planctomycetaceae bacterium]|nr:tRNA pseudouridine(38-40) synthase TruA [Planctomycetaceae bacterium]